LENAGVEEKVTKALVKILKRREERSNIEIHGLYDHRILNKKYCLQRNLDLEKFVS